MNQGRLLLVLGLRPLAKRPEACQGQMLFVLRDFREIWSRRQGKSFIWKNHWKQLGPKSCMGQSLKKSPGWGKQCKLIGRVSDMVRPNGSVEDGLIK